MNVEEAPDPSQWVGLRLAYLTERVQLTGTEGAWVALVRATLEAYNTGQVESLDQPYDDVVTAVRLFPRSAALLEYKILLEAMLNRVELDETIAALERVRPTSSALQALRESGQGSAHQWQSDVDQTQWDLLEQAGSADRSVAEAAVGELHRWMRSFPRNSTYAINYALALLAQERFEEAGHVAAATLAIEDGSFADAYNLGLVLLHAGQPDEGRRLLHLARQRAGTAEERSLADEASR